jgi:hypothetical protein
VLILPEYKQRHGKNQGVDKIFIESQHEFGFDRACHAHVRSKNTISIDGEADTASPFRRRKPEESSRKI